MKHLLKCLNIFVEGDWLETDNVIHPFMICIFSSVNEGGIDPQGFQSWWASSDFYVIIFTLHWNILVFNKFEIQLVFCSPSPKPSPFKKNRKMKNRIWENIEQSGLDYIITVLLFSCAVEEVISCISHRFVATLWDLCGLTTWNQ